MRHKVGSLPPPPYQLTAHQMLQLATTNHPPQSAVVSIVRRVGGSLSSATLLRSGDP